MAGAGDDRQLPARTARPLPRLPGPARVPGLLGAGVPAAVPRPDQPDQRPARVGRGAPREPLAAGHGAARAGRAHPRRVRPTAPATTSSTATTSSSRRSSASPGRGSRAASSSTGRSTTARPPSCPTDVEIEHEPDGAVTVWCSDHDPFARMKGMHGVRLRPDRASIELRVRLYNRTSEHADVPVVGQRRRPRARATTSRSSRATCASSPTTPGGRSPRSRRPTGPTTASTTRPGRGAPAATASTGTATSPCRPRTCAWAAEEDFFGGYDHAARRRLRARRRPADVAVGQEAVDVGQRRVRARVGPQPHRRRRPRTSS